MDQALLVHEVYARTYLDEEVKSRVLGQALFLADQVEQIALARVLERQVDDLLVLEAGEKAADVLVVQLLLDPDLPNQRLLDLAARQRRLDDLFDRHQNSGLLVAGELDLTVAALAEVGLRLVLAGRRIFDALKARLGPARAHEDNFLGGLARRGSRRRRCHRRHRCFHLRSHLQYIP